MLPERLCFDQGVRIDSRIHSLSVLSCSELSLVLRKHCYMGGREGGER